MFVEERRKNIVSLLQNKKRASVNELSKTFDVSRATIRRDLSELEKSGFLRRTHGGAILSGSSKLEPTFKEKEDKLADEKKSIGKKAAEIIKDGDTIFIDAGTTTRQIIDFLEDKKNITIVTHALHIINKINEDNLDCELIVIGGNFKKSTEAMIGPLAEDYLKKLRVDKSFIGSNGFNLDSAATTPDLSEAKIKEIGMEIAGENFLLFDQSKWEDIYFYRFAELKQIDFIITDYIDENREKSLKQENINIILA
ncbi:DeoR family transcriptional regulator [Halanaerobium saccharolyticum]|uniref:DeoR family transcriptional regulator n=1 Tax=Halanaerobium saccharolyticum TaxID=43595 RepID=A0A4R7YWY8_9FIRM|nr:DeoR/GlpR family DNA-binding transcription regulator [Halanaerobium saccharolyticum]RAK06914.1 DeoR family transcriptional regulator [Halanaerobium saccharolyticum]TDW01641.1 DeoR family transcriptional regulator [Halanaerobium saccharolyticum]TDX53039.1 DeoR family transcriptional regulator [Halanaerobium saccharolyticum]